MNVLFIEFLFQIYILLSVHKYCIFGMVISHELSFPSSSFPTLPSIAVDAFCVDGFPSMCPTQISHHKNCTCTVSPPCECAYDWPRFPGKRAISDRPSIASSTFPCCEPCQDAFVNHARQGSLLHIFHMCKTCSGEQC